MMAHPFPEIADEVVRIIDWQSMNIPARHGTIPAFKDLSKRLWFSSSSDVSSLSSAVDYMCIYGFLERARKVSLSLAPIPNGYPNVVYPYINGCFLTACCFLERAGYVESARPLRDVALNSPGVRYELGPAALDGSMLFNFFDKPSYDPKYQIGQVFGDITCLTYLWVYGSTSPNLERNRVSELMDINLDHIRSLTKWKPWEHVEEPVESTY